MTSTLELRELDDDELEHRLAEGRRELLNLRFQLATGQLDNTARLGTVRREVARLLTILREREIALAEGRYAGPVAAPERPDRPERPARAGRAEVVGEEELSEQGLDEDVYDENEPEQGDEIQDAEDE